MDLFLPCLLLSSIGGTLDPTALRGSWHLVVGSTFSIGISSSLAWMFGWLLVRRDARQTFRLVQMAITFPNSLVFPLILLDALCEQDVINGLASFCCSVFCFDYAVAPACVVTYPLFQYSGKRI